MVAGLYSTKPLLLRSSTSTSSWPSQTSESPSILSTQTPTASTPAVSLQLWSYASSCYLVSFWFYLNICTDWASLSNFQFCWTPLMKNFWKRTSRLHPVQRGMATKESALCDTFLSILFWDIFPVPFKVTATCQSSPMDEENRVHFHRVQQIWCFQWESGSQVSWTPLYFSHMHTHVCSECSCKRDISLTAFRIGVSVKQQFTEEEIYKDRDSQISAIEKTFEDAQKPVRRHINMLLKFLLNDVISFYLKPPQE